MKRLPQLLALALALGAPLADAAHKPAPARLLTPATPPSAHSQLHSTPSFWEDIGSHTDFNYFAQFNGPALGRPLIEAHTTSGEGGPYPISLYHELDLIFHPTRDFTFGGYFSASQDLARGVVNRYGNEVIPTFSLLQPSVFIKHQRVIETDWLRVAAQVSVMLPTSSYAIEERILGAVAFDQTWNIKLSDRRWQLYFTTRLQPTFYQYSLPVPEEYDGFSRETFFLSAGHYVGYHFNANWELSNSSLFDANHLSHDPNGLMSFGSAGEDRMQLQLTYYHGSGVFYVGALVQSVLANPRINTSVVGAVVKINFLKSRY